MSLDVYLYGKESKPQQARRIFIREGGRQFEITREEWDRRFPDLEPITVTTESVVKETNLVFSANITHNLGNMASEAGIYKYLWRPEEIGVHRAQQLIQPLKEGLALLESSPEQFTAFNPKNGWGSYDGLVRFVGEYLQACEENPDADVSVSR